MTPVEEAWLRLQLLLGEHREVGQRAELDARERAFMAEREAAGVSRGR